MENFEQKYIELKKKYAILLKYKQNIKKLMMNYTMLLMKKDSYKPGLMIQLDNDIFNQKLICDDKNFAYHALCMTLFPAADILYFIMMSLRLIQIV
ncbi:hypothetical protein pb186bvf_014997 [Paramecium bursaria]